MNNFITPILRRSSTVTATPQNNVDRSGTFRDMLTGVLDDIKSRQAQNVHAEPAILVGEITLETPTVSELLIQHEELSSSTWDIIYSEKNQSKQYTKIRPGTRIYFHREENTLSWSGSGRDPSSSKEAAVLTYPPAITPSVHKNSSEHRVKNDMLHTAGSNDTAVAGMSKVDRAGVQAGVFSGDVPSVSLGRIDDTNTTVSHLLQKHSRFREQTWKILGSSTNKNKPFNRIAKGTEIFLQPDNMEINWGPAVNTTPLSYPFASEVSGKSSLNSGVREPTDRPATDLSEAVKRYLGTPYDEINCYELLVKGLGHMNIPYRGRDGLFSKLTRMALDRGMAPNAFLNGEGVVKAAGSLVLSKSYADLANWRGDAEALIREIEPLLDNGQILSFSTENRGHTGIVSNQNRQWTFINSGRLDNSVSPNRVRRGVGEEVLHEEILNWFKLAHSKNETLSVTLGRVERDKTSTAYNMTESASKQT